MLTTRVRKAAHPPFWMGMPRFLSVFIRCVRVLDQFFHDIAMTICGRGHEHTRCDVKIGEICAAHNA